MCCVSEGCGDGSVVCAEDWGGKVEERIMSSLSDETYTSPYRSMC